jgi:hypothetical protein
VLVERAKARKTITYSELSVAIDVMHIPAFSFMMVRLLDDISQENERLGEPSLATLVVRKANNRPGVGYFRKSWVGLELPSDLERYWQNEFEKVCKAWED